MAEEAATRRTWSSEAIGALVRAVAGSPHLATLMASTSVPNLDAWQGVVRAMGAHGAEKNIQQLRAKWKALKGAFHREREHRRSHSGQASHQCPPLYLDLHRMWVRAGRPVFGSRQRTDAMRREVDARASAEAHPTVAAPTQEEASHSSTSSVLVIDESGPSTPPHRRQATGASRRERQRCQPARAAKRRLSSSSSSSSSSVASTLEDTEASVSAPSGSRRGLAAQRARSCSPLQAHHQPVAGEHRWRQRRSPPGEGPAPREGPLDASQQGSPSASQAASQQGSPSASQAASQQGSPSASQQGSLAAEEPAQGPLQEGPPPARFVSSSDAGECSMPESEEVARSEVVPDVEPGHSSPGGAQEAEKQVEEVRAHDPSLPMPAAPGASNSRVLQRLVTGQRRLLARQGRLLAAQDQVLAGLLAMQRQQRQGLGDLPWLRDALQGIRDGVDRLAMLSESQGLAMERLARSSLPRDMRQMRANLRSVRSHQAMLQTLLLALLTRLAPGGDAL